MRDTIRNIAIIAHVDHGKTTLVDALLRQSHTHLDKDQQAGSLIMDSNELERERGITIFSKNASVVWCGTTINIIDTPGHADFGGEVERVLAMADGCLLLVDAKEGPMPQTRFVLRKALAQGHRIIVVINKIDRPDAQPDDALTRTFDLFVELGADDATLDFPVLYASAKEGKAGEEASGAAMEDITPLFEAIVRHIPCPTGDPAAPAQLIVASVTKDPYRGRMAMGRMVNGTLRQGMRVVRCTRDGNTLPTTITALMTFRGLERIEVPEVLAGDIVAVAGMADVQIGETIADADAPKALPPLAVEEPTVTMTFRVNDSPFAGIEGQYSTSRQLRERLHKELETDMALRVADERDGTWTVAGRGELHLAILIERLRREGYELQVSRPKVILRTERGQTMAPFERVTIEVPEEHTGVVLQKIGQRRGTVLHMDATKGVSFLDVLMPTRGLFGYRREFVTDTRGLGVLHASFDSYKPDPATWQERQNGSLVAHESGTTSMYGLLNVQNRGTLFLGPAVRVYQGMVVGQHARPGDLRVNVCKTKQLSNMRSKGEGGAEHFKMPQMMDLEDALEYIADDELVEVTPVSVRMRKTVLDPQAERRKELGIRE